MPMRYVENVLSYERLISRVLETYIGRPVLKYLVLSLLVRRCLDV